jgi:hypothetical protein
MTYNELTRRFPHASRSFIKANLTPGLPDPFAERDPGQTAAVSDGGKKASPSSPGICVKILSRRRRPLDPDNLFVKSLVDALRYEGLIPGDSAADIDLQISQEKVFRKLEEMTIVELTTL